MYKNYVNIASLPPALFQGQKHKDMKQENVETHTFIIILYTLTLKLQEKLQLYGLYVHYVVHICDFGMLRVKQLWKSVTCGG